MNANTARISTMRLYGSAIAVVSGVYSVFLSTNAEMMGSMWGMLLLGLIVLVHGVVLLTDWAAQLGEWSGPLMIGYSVLMLLNQAWVESTASMESNAMGGGMTTSTMGSAGADSGMVAIAVLMLASGFIMTVRREMMS